MAEFVLKNDSSEFKNVFQQMSGIATGKKIAVPYTCISMDQIQTKFLRTQTTNLWYDLDTSTIFFLFGLMENNNLRNYNRF